MYVICQSGARGRQACERLAAAGLAQGVNVEGGTTAWVAGGFPVTRGRRSVSLERQVRMAAAGRKRGRESIILTNSLDCE